MSDTHTALALVTCASERDADTAQDLIDELPRGDLNQLTWSLAALVWSMILQLGEAYAMDPTEWLQVFASNATALLEELEDQ